MIPNSTVVGFAVAMICTLIVPVILVIVLCVKKKASFVPLLLGAAAFFISQVLLRIPLLNALSTQSWYLDFAARYAIPLLLLVCLSAGVFEETARLAGAHILKTKRSFKDIISFGLGHGLCEVIILVGLTQFNNLTLSMAINNGGAALAGSMSPEQLAMVTFQLASVDSAHIYLSVLERFSAVVFHVFATVLVFKGVVEKKPRYYLLAILAHTVFNAAGVLLVQYVGIVVSEIALLAMALAGGYYVICEKKRVEGQN